MMSDDTSDTPVESVHTNTKSAADPSIDTLATITITIEQDGHKQEIEFKARPHELECDMESFTLPLDDFFPPHVIRTKRQKFRFGLNARPMPDPETGVAYTITRTPAG